MQSAAGSWASRRNVNLAFSPSLKKRCVQTTLDSGALLFFLAHVVPLLVTISESMSSPLGGDLLATEMTEEGIVWVSAMTEEGIVWVVFPVGFGDKEGGIFAGVVVGIPLMPREANC